MANFKEKPNINNDKYTILNFQNVAKKINTYLKEDNIFLSFEGYKETISEYLSLQENDIETAYKLMIESNLWNNYLCEVEGMVQVKMLNSQLEVDILKADKISRVKNEELEAKIKTANNKHYSLKLFYKQVKGQRKFFIKAYYHCLGVYNSSKNTLTYKSLD